jgi:5-methylcytosine-specific restriction endonuclease McrA
VWRAENPEKQAEACRNWQLNNWEAQQEVWRRAEQAKQEREEQDPEYKAKRRAQGRKHSLDSHRRRYGVDASYTERVKANAAHQKVKRRRLMGLVELTPAEELQVKAIYRLRYTLTRETGIEYHVDHRIPLKHGGKHHPDNLWVITAKENLSKGAKLLP